MDICCYTASLDPFNNCLASRAECFGGNMNNKEITTPTNNSNPKSGAWHWILTSIVVVIVVKLFGPAATLVTVGLYFWLKPKIGIWGAVAISGVFGFVAAIGLSAMLGNLASTSPAIPTSSTQEFPPKPAVDSKGWTQESTGSTEVGPWLSYSPPGTRYCRLADRTIQRLYPPGVRPNLAEANPFCLGESSESVPQ